MFISCCLEKKRKEREERQTWRGRALQREMFFATKKRKQADTDEREAWCMYTASRYCIYLTIDTDIRDKARETEKRRKRRKLAKDFKGESHKTERNFLLQLALSSSTALKGEHVPTHCTYIEISIDRNKHIDIYI